jgi:hypothetical protein
MPKKDRGYEKGKLGSLLAERGITYKEFAEMVFIKTGYFIAISNLCNYATGWKPITRIDIAKHFADTLEVPITDIL